MNLYSIDFRHYSPKDSEYGIKTYLIAQDDEAVFDWIANYKGGDEFGIYTSWLSESNEEVELYDDDTYKLIGVVSYKQKIIYNKGEIGDSSKDFSDVFYGITEYGWTLIKENLSIEETETLLKLNIANYKSLC